MMTGKSIKDFSITQGGISILFFIFAALSFFLPVEPGDIWWHLKSGEYMVQHHRVPYVDPFPFAAESPPWVFTQWLGSLIYYAAYSGGGLAGLQWLRMFLFLLVLYIFVKYGSTRMPLSWLLFLAYLVSYGLRARALLRPDAFNFIFIELFLIHLIQFQRTQRYIHLISTALLGLFWVNIHLGSFMYGVLLISLFLFAGIIKYIKSNILREESAQAVAAHKKTCQWLTVIWLIYLLTFFLTPYGLDGFLHPYKTLLIKDYIHFDRLAVAIDELRPPQNILSPSYIWLYVLFIGSLWSALRDDKNRFLHVILLGFGFFMFLYSYRALTFFTLICGFIIVNSSEELRLKQRWQELRWSRGTDTLLKICLVLLLSYHLIKFYHLRAVYHDRVFHWLSIRENHESAKKTVDLLEKHHISGRIFNDGLYSGYILWHGYPALRPYLDNRQLDFKAYENLNIISRDPAKYFPMMDQYLQFKIVFLNAGKQHHLSLIRYFVKDPQWVLISVDGSCVLFVRKDAFDLPKELLEFEKKLRAFDPLLEDYMKKIASIKEPRQHPYGHFVDLFKTDYYYLDDHSTGIAYFDMGFYAAGIDLVWKAFEFDDNIRVRTTLKSMARQINILRNQQEEK